MVELSNDEAPKCHKVDPACDDSPDWDLWKDFHVVPVVPDLRANMHTHTHKRLLRILGWQTIWQWQGTAMKTSHHRQDTHNFQIEDVRQIQDLHLEPARGGTGQSPTSLLAIPAAPGAPWPHRHLCEATDRWADSVETHDATEAVAPLPG